MTETIWFVRNYPFQQLSNLILKYEDKAKEVKDTPQEEWIEGYNKCEKFTKQVREKIYERNPNTGVIRWRYVGESPDKFG